jgi:hemerythrin-like domain-containing protein
MKITQALQAEHVVFHNLFDYIERTAPRLRTAAETRALAGLLEAMLKVHSVMEDELLIAPLEPHFSQLGQDENFHAEHEEIDHCLEQAGKARQLAAARRWLQRAVLLSRRHFDREERIVFPLAEQLLSARSQEALGHRWEKHRKHLLA